MLMLMKAPVEISMGADLKTDPDLYMFLHRGLWIGKVSNQTV